MTGMEYTARPNPDHDYDHPDSERNRLRVLAAMNDRKANPRCRRCDEQRVLIAMPGTAWGWESFHGRQCPTHEDNQQVEAVHVTDQFDGATYSEAEAIWSADRPAD
jgi:hypothetical protein